MDAGKISKELAEKKALEHYEIYSQKRLKKADEESVEEITELENLD